MLEIAQGLPREQWPVIAAAVPATPETPPAAADPEDRLVTVSAFLQDPQVERGQPQLIDVPARLVQPHGRRLEGPHFATTNYRNPQILAADEDGNLIFPTEGPAFDEVNAQVHAEKTVAMFERMLGRPIQWNFGDPRRHLVSIHVNQHEPEGSTSQFSTKILKLDAYRSVALGKEVRDSESTDGISHEVAHFVLNSLRPDLDTDDTETAAFHESFSDVAAMLYGLEYDENIHRMVSETRGDWQRQNSIAEFGEEDGKATQLKDAPNSHQAHALRSAINDFAYQPPEELQPSCAVDRAGCISAEPHDFAKIFTGAFYDVLTGLAQRGVDQGADTEAALRAARDRIEAIWAVAIQHLPEKQIKFADAAQAMMDADRALGGPDLDVLQKGFADRAIAAH